MKKIIIFIVGLFFCFLSNMSALADTDNSIINDNGLMIDVARHPMTENEIIKIINTIDSNKFDYIQLHLSDNEHLSYQSQLIGNKKTNTVLSPKELKNIQNIANEKGLYIVPDIDLPSHSKSILSELKKYRPKLYQKIKMDEETIDYTSLDAIDFAKKLYTELINIFGNQTEKYIMIGIDEVPGCGNFQNELSNYVNALNATINNNGFRTLIWNDSISKQIIEKLNNNIIINYWSQSGDHSEKIELKRRYDNNISVLDIKNSNHDIINANSYSNYYMIKNIGNIEDEDYFLNFLENNYTPNMFNEINDSLENNYFKIENSINTKGTLIALWGEESEDINFQNIINFINKLNSSIKRAY